MWANSIEAAFFQACEWLDLCARNGITLNPKKFQFAQDTVNFAGLTITPTNIRPSTKFLDAISNFPTPTDITGARAWFGLINQGAYAFAMARQMKPFRALLKPSTTFCWTNELDEVFHKSKEIIIQEMKEGVRLFDPARMTCLATDWSVDGIGFFLMQKYCQCSNSERSITLTDIDNRRLLNLKEKTLGYRFTILHVPGRKNLGPDAASRYPVGPPDRLNLPGEAPELDSLVNMTTHYHDTLTSLCLHTEDNDTANDASTVAAATCALNAVITVVTWNMVREATASDPTFVNLIRQLEAGFPEDYKELPTDLRPYHRFASSLCTVDGVVLMGQRIVIPPALRKPVLNALHAAHQGVSAMRARAMDSVYWPEITVDIARVRDQCVHCHQMAKSNPMQPPSDITPPDYPFQMICSDYFTYNSNDYVVIVDRYSNWPMVYKSESGAEGLVKRLRETFVTFGIPEELTSDGGPQFTAGKTQEFLKAWGVRHRLSSVANPHANCRAEIAVKTVKRMLVDNITAVGSLDVDKFQRALLMYRNSIDPETKASPALILFGRPIRDAIPILMGRYSPHETWTELMSHREMALAKRHSREHERWNEHTHHLPTLQVGDHVYIQNLVGNHPRRWERTGTVVEVRQYHQYVIRVDGTGRVTIRNRQHLRKFTPFQTNQTQGTLMAPTAVQHQEVILSSPSTPKTTQPQVPKIPVSLSPTRILSQPAALNETPIIVPTQKQATQTQTIQQPSQIDLDQSFHQTPEPDTFNTFPGHSFRSKWQTDQLKKLVENLPENECVTVHDFSENYRCTERIEIQSSYFQRTEVSIHVTLIYRRAVLEIDGASSTPDDPNIICEHFYVISPDGKHDQYFTRHVQNLVSEYLKEINYRVDTMHEFCEGCQSQYKSRHCIGTLVESVAEFGYKKIIRNYFESCHGKGPQDAAGGLLKNQADIAVIRGQFQIRSAVELFQFAQSRLTTQRSYACKRRIFKYVEENKIPRNRKSFKPIKGIPTIHRVETKNLQTVLVGTVSCYCDACLEGDHCLFTDQVGISLEVKIEAEDSNSEDETLEDDSYETVADMINIGQIFAVLCDDEENDFFLFKATSGSHMLTRN
ncbi:unnamed protein product [Mytilus edulis]|uniref:Integrase catalytic domain-containing protein n=1 Tax=Mytilus edulis TaxID=6550 RepID=A0A8S3V989_MYTED|nr:unnamed protein product [Mytilus edulis]